MNDISRVTVVGGGYMGGGIAQVFALAGYRVRIADVSVEAADKALARLLLEAKEFESQGLFAPGSAETIAANLSAGLDLEQAVADADFIEEAVFEVLDVKRDVLARISRAAAPDAIIGTNTSTLPVRELIGAVVGPERFLTVHFSNPAPFIPGVELVAGEATAPTTVDAVKELLSAIGRHGALVADSPGMVLNRLQYALLREAFLLVEDGVATVEDVDAIVRTTFGFRLGFFGPFAIADQAGLDVYVEGFKTIEGAFGERFSTPALLTEAVAAGKHGLKNGHGLLRDFDESDRERLVAYRNRAYARMLGLVEELGPAPLAAEAPA
ncbi:3-hydroxyacyl-CoA dehydrogenase family protein [Pseudactinotalea sp. HY158]|nr:3-hydroxyacyl-CoA dehydrogenase family protein [Pseudactinotalea sp. HY158]